MQLHLPDERWNRQAVRVDVRCIDARRNARRLVRARKRDRRFDVTVHVEMLFRNLRDQPRQIVRYRMQLEAQRRRWRDPETAAAAGLQRGQREIQARHQDAIVRRAARGEPRVFDRERSDGSVMKRCGAADGQMRSGAANLRDRVHAPGDRQLREAQRRQPGRQIEIAELAGNVVPRMRDQLRELRGRCEADRSGGAQPSMIASDVHAALRDVAQTGPMRHRIADRKAPVAQPFDVDVTRGIRQLVEMRERETERARPCERISRVEIIVEVAEIRMRRLHRERDFTLAERSRELRLGRSDFHEAVLDGDAAASRRDRGARVAET